jgi:predicted nuclease of predicted toxin-antitoxin system
MLRLLADESLNGDIVAGLRLRQPDLDMVRVQDVGLRTADDPAILEWAAVNGRIVITADRKTMINLAWMRVVDGRTCPESLSCDPR